MDEQMSSDASELTTDSKSEIAVSREETKGEESVIKMGFHFKTSQAPAKTPVFVPEDGEIETEDSYTEEISENEVINYIKRNPFFLTDYIVNNYDTATLNRWAASRKSVGSDSQIGRESYHRKTRCQTIIPMAMQQKMAGFSVGQEKKIDETETLEKKFEAIKGIASVVTADADTLVIVKLFRECVLQSTHCEAGFIFMAHSDGDHLALIDPSNEESTNNIRRLYQIHDSYVPACYAASVKQIILINHSDDDGFRYNRSYLPTDKITSVMAIPVTEEDGTLVAVVEVYRSEEDETFQPEDEDIADTYCQWARTTLTFSSMYHTSLRQQRVNSFILKLAQTIFNKISTIDEVMIDIVSYAKALLRAERSALFLLNESKTQLEVRIIDSPDGRKVCVPPEETRGYFPVDQGIVGSVAQSGKTENLIDAKRHPKYDPLVDSRPKCDAHSMLCVPVRVKEETIGVMQLINSADGKFSKDSEEYFRTFALYCAVALHLARMYQANIKSQQQCKATLEVMSLHTQCTEAEVKALKKQPLPNRVPKITSFQYSPWSVPQEQKVVHVIFMFQDLFGSVDRTKAQWLRFDINTVLRFVLTVRKNYRAVPYHNWDHACAVNQASYLIIRKCVKGRFALEEEVAMFIGALCHDIDHRGKTNKFMIDNQSPLAALYTTSTMEQHHFNLTVTILQRDGHNIFQMLSSHRYRTILDLIKHCIIATDISLYIEKTAKELNTKLDEGPLDFTCQENRMLLIANCMTACDLSAMYKPWNVQFTVVLIIMKEFWLEGDEEKKLGKKPIPMMDRDFQHMLPASQVGFISFICLPCYKMLARVFPEYDQAVEGVTINLNRWQALKDMDEEPRMQKLAEMELKIVNLKRNLVTADKNRNRQSFHFASQYFKTTPDDASDEMSTSSESI